MTPEEFLNKGKSILAAKAHDYTEDPEENRYQSFERQAELMSWFESNQDKAFIALIAVKIARLSALLNTDKIPKNESIEDSFTDLINYCALWAGSRTSDRVSATHLRAWMCASLNCRAHLEASDTIIWQGGSPFCSEKCAREYAG